MATTRPFIGRRAELTQTNGVLLGCRDSNSGLTVCIRGEAGVGKTRLGRVCPRGRRVPGAQRTKVVLDFGTGRGQDAVRSSFKVV